MRQRKRKLITIAILALALLVGATFAFTAFNQQAINDRANAFRSHAPGRIHDYYNRDTGNKDIFAENYGHDADGNQIMVRIRLSEYMAIQRLGEDNFTPIVEHAEREDTRTWTPYRSAQNDINVRTGDSLAFNNYIDLTFGWQRAGQEAPWYMPTFNHELEDIRTAAAGHARDYIQGGGAKDGETDGTTHPGDGTDAYWTESDANSSYNNSAGTWPGATITQETKQHLQQERPPMTIQQWEQLNPNQRFGNFWVLDHNTGWAYWAELLEEEQATSYLLDSAVVRDEVVRRSFVNGSYYYAIHVDSQVISPLDIDRFLEEEDQGQHDTRLADFLEVVAGDGNPRWNRDSDISDFDFDLMSRVSPGRIFTMAGQQFRYLENLGKGNHMIIRNQTLMPNVQFHEQNDRLTRWYTEEFLPTDPELRAKWEEHVVPLGSFNVGTMLFSQAQVGTNGRIGNWSAFPVAAADITANQLLPISQGGTRRAFTLSVADVDRLTAPGPFGFFSVGDRWTSGGGGVQWTRTPSNATQSWEILHTGLFSLANNNIDVHRSVRPALILHQ